ncbi:hypothetical protein [Halorarum halobium]|uniref:hypothetical protein n=1 Tax=Halorarum halobium TaxID=3075121 RepID=UPI0028AF82C5|nr:hypothetical protein [Halobaculum sp. XH14]
MSLNKPMPKGGYRTILEIVNILGGEGSQSVRDLVSELDQFGYRIVQDDSGEDHSPALSPGGHTYSEITQLLNFVEAKGDDPLDTELSLTEESENNFGTKTSGRKVYDILSTDKLDDETKRGAVSALILSLLCEADIDTSNVTIPNAFRTFLTKVWEQKDKSTGRYQTNWRKDNTYFKDILTDPEISEDWNEEKLRHCATRAIDLGVCRRSERGGSSDLICPVLVEDIFQASVFYMNHHYRKDLADTTPNIRQFYSDLSKWYPIAKEFFEQNVLYDGILHQNTKISDKTYPVLHDLLNRNNNETNNYQVRWFEGEDSWDENVRFAEFEFGVM